VGNEIEFDEVLVTAVSLAVMTVLAVLCYRAMERPRLVLTPTPDGPRALRADVIKYAVSIPFLAVLWILYFLAILTVARNNLDAAGVLVTAAGVVIGTRILAHLWSDAAREIGKVVPLTIVTLVLIAGNTREDSALNNLATELESLDYSWLSYTLILTFDYVITAIWYWGWIRWGQPVVAARLAERSQSLPEGTGQGEGNPALGKGVQDGG